jgi:SHS2 domain-containing protein
MVIFSEFDLRVSETGIEAAARGERLDPDRHRRDHEVKAITYHELKVIENQDGLMAEVIVDI